MRKPIPLWRITLYSFLFATLNGTLIISGSVQWKPFGLFAGFVACMMAWLHGSTNGKRAGRDATIADARIVVDEHRKACNAELAKIHKQVAKHIAKTDQQINEGEEWKLGGAQEETDES